MTKNQKVDIGIVLFAMIGILGLMVPGYQIWDTLPYGAKKLTVGLCVALASVIVIAAEDFWRGKIGWTTNIAIITMLLGICAVAWATIFDLGSSMMR